MDGVAGFHAFEICGIAGLDRELVGVLPVHLEERAAHLVAPPFIHGGRKQASAHHGEALVCRDGFPNGLDTAKGMLNRLKCLLASLAADLTF